MPLPTTLEPFDIRLTAWLSRHGITITRWSLGLVFLWFGALKFVPDWSPAAELATRTIQKLTFGQIQPALGLPLLAAWEAVVGLGLLTGKFLRATLLLLALQMLGTLLPLAMFPHETFQVFPIAPTLEGQYIIKNVVLISAALVIGATVRGGGLKSTGNSPAS